MAVPPLTVELREVQPDDLPVFYAFNHDPVARHMAAFGPPNQSDLATYVELWRGRLARPDIIVRTIVADGQVVGNIVRFAMDGQPNVGYWIDRAHWGRGIASRALAAFLAIVAERPLFAGVVTDNAGSQRVLERCGFREVRRARVHSSIRNQEVEEILLRLGDEA